MVRGSDPLSHGGDAAVALAAEAKQDRLDQRGVVEADARNLSLLHRGREDERWNARSVPAEAGIIVLGRLELDVVVETAVLVVGDDEHRAPPLRAAEQGMNKLEHELLTGTQVRGRMVVV